MRGLLVLCAFLVWTAELEALYGIRVELLRCPENLNNITLICRNNSVNLDTADFWVNSTDQPLTSILSNYSKGMGKIQFFLYPDIEGSYHCGNISADLASSNNWTLVAYPIQNKNVSDFYTAEVGSSITLSCPFARGALTQFYSYSWKEGFTTVVGNMQHTPRFSGNSTDFSLTIQDLILSDSSEYFCRVFITNPIGNDWTITSDPIQLSVNVSPPAPSTSPVSNSVFNATNTTSMMNPLSRSPLTFYEVACIVISGVLLISFCAVGGISILKLWAKKRPWHEQSEQRQPDSPVEITRAQVNNLPTDCDQRDQTSCQFNQDEENGSLEVFVGDENSGFESADDVTFRYPSSSDNQNRGSQNLETPSGCEGPECAVPLGDTQSASTMDQLQSQEHSVPPSEGTRGIPANLPIGLTAHLRDRNSPSVRSGFGRQSRQDSGLSPLSDAVTNSSVQSRSCPSRSTETFPLQIIDDYQVESNELMFLGSVRVLVCDSRGGRFSIPEHDITLSFPQGAVPDTVEIEVGVAVHGLFEFPDDLRPISVLVWVQAKTPKFQKPVEISLPHYLKLSKKDVRNSSNLGLGFMVTDRQDEHHHLIFKEGAKEQVSYKQTEAIISTTHFCYMCLSAKASVIAEKGCYLLTQVQPESVKSLRWQIHFCVTYNLSSFIEMIKQQYRSKGEVVSQKPFKFISQPLEEKTELKILYQPPMKGWQLTLPTYKTIPQSAVELWDDDVSMLQNRVMLQLFPPRVTVEVAGEGAFGNTTQLFSFEGAHQNLESEVHLCLPAEHVAQHKNTLQHLEFRHASIARLDPLPSTKAIIPHHSCPGNMVSLPPCQAHPNEPTEQELFEVMKVIITMGPNWRTLIGLLDIPPDKEQEILQDDLGTKTQILRMLHTWNMLHQGDGTNTRTNLAATLRDADPCLRSAVKILERQSQS